MSLIGEDNTSRDIDLADQGEDGPDPVASRRRRYRVSLLVIAAIAVIFVAIYFFNQALGDAWLYGYFGAFLISLMASAVVIIPVPGLPVVFFLGAILNPAIVGLMVGLGEPLGELTGYMAGYSGRFAVENRKLYTRLEAGMRRRGTLILLLSACVPNPVFDVVGAAAGALRYPVWKYLLVLFVGKTIKGMLVAYAGYWTLGLLIRYLIG